MPDLHFVGKEPAWPSVMAGHRPVDWPGHVAPANYHQDLIYLRSEKVLSDDDVQVIQSFYFVMMVRHVNQVQ